MYHMNIIYNNQKRWRNCIILGSLLNEIEEYCKNEDSTFANPTQFISYAIRKELDHRQNNVKKLTEEQIKEKLDGWVNQIKEEMDLESRLQNAFRNSKSHTALLSENR